MFLPKRTVTLEWIANFQFHEVDKQTTFMGENRKEQNIQFS